MLVSGVRSSWLTIERKSSLIRCAACSRAMRSWRSDHSCAFWSAGPARSATASAMRRIRSSSGRSARPAVASTPCSRPPARIGTASEPVEAERAHPVGIAGLRSRRRVAWRVAAVAPRLRSAPRPAAGGVHRANARHASTSSPSGPAAAAGARQPLGVVDREDQRRAAEHRRGPVGDRLERGARDRARRRSRGRAG